MRSLLLPLPLLFIVLVALSGCGRDPDPPLRPCVTPGDVPNLFDTEVPTRNPAIIDLCTYTPTPEPTQPEIGPTSLPNNTGLWYRNISQPLHQLRGASDAASQAFPDYATNPDATSGYANSIAVAAGQALGIIGQFVPPAEVETQYAALLATLQAVLAAASAVPPDAPTIAAAQADFVGACEPLQQYADSNDIDIDLRCSGPITPLSAADFFAAIAPAVAAMHEKVDQTQATFDGLPPAQQVELSPLSVYLSGIATAYGAAGLAVADPAAPANVASAQQAFADAADAIVIATQQLDNEVKNSPDLPAVKDSIAATLTPLQDSLEAACGDLQAAADAAGVNIDLGCRD